MIRRLLLSFGEKINPILLLELRRSVRGKLAVVSFFLFLLLALLLLIIPLQEMQDGVVVNGGNTFLIFFGLLMAVGLVPLQIFTLIRTGMERRAEGIDLLFVSGLSPMKITLGKIASANALFSLLFFALLPFITMSFFMTGVDIPTIFLLLLHLFLIVVVVNCFTIMAAAWIRSVLWLVAGVIGIIFMGFTLFGFLISVCENILRGGGYLWFLADKDLFLVLFYLVFILYGIPACLLVGAAGMDSPAEDRGRKPRLFFSVWWLIFLVIAIFNGDDLAPLFWFHGSAIGTMTMLFAVNSPQELPRRSLVNVKPGLWRRLPYFLLSGGAPGAWLWGLLMNLLTVLSYLFVFDRNGSPEELLIPCFLTLYFTVFVMLPSSLKRIFFKGFQRRFFWLLSGISMLFFLVFPYLISLFAQDLGSLKHLGNPVMVVETGMEIPLVLGFLVFILLLYIHRFSEISGYFHQLFAHEEET